MNSVDDFWNSCLSTSSNAAGDGGFVENGFDDPEYRNIVDQMFGDEEFREAGVVFNENRSMHDLQYISKSDLEKSGIRTSAKIPRTDSMSSSGSDYVSADSYFQRRSENVDDIGLPKNSGQLNKAFPRDSPASECLERSDRSTLTQADIMRLIKSSQHEENKKAEIRNSSLCSGRSSLNTIAAFEELDRLIQDLPSDDEDSEEQPALMTSVQNTRVKRQSSQYATFPSTFKNGLPSTEKRAKTAKNIPTALSSSPSVIKASDIRPYLDTIKRDLTNIERRTKSSLVESTFLLNSRTTSVLDKVYRRQYSRDQHPIKNISSSQPRSSKGTYEMEQDDGQTVNDEQTKALLRHADDVLARAAQRRSTKPQLNPAVHRPQSENVIGSSRIEVNRENKVVSTEPTSAPQPKNWCGKNRSSQTELERSENDPSSHNVSILEQSTYPVNRKSILESHDVVLATRQIFFPPTEVGESSSAKLQVKNYTSVAFQLKFSAVPSPFESRYDTLTIAPKRYINVPLRFIPRSTGYFQTEIVVSVEPGLKQMYAHIIGEGIPKLRISE